MPLPNVHSFQKIARLSRPIVVTEKIDGINAMIAVNGNGDIRARTRSRWLSASNDTFGFAAWVQAHRDELLQLGPGNHFGEWWGAGIARGYGLTGRRFSLFDLDRWSVDRPGCCNIVPVLYRGPFEQNFILKGIRDAMARLQYGGSIVAPGFMDPEGIVVWHEAAGVMFKKTLGGNGAPKSRAA